MRGSSYLLLPDCIEKKEAIINSQNDNEECFKWTVIAALEWTEINSHPERVLNFKKLSQYRNEYLVTPMSLTPQKFLGIFHLVGVFTASLHMAKLRIH